MATKSETAVRGEQIAAELAARSAAALAEANTVVSSVDPNSPANKGKYEEALKPSQVRQSSSEVTMIETQMKDEKGNVIGIPLEGRPEPKLGKKYNIGFLKPNGKVRTVQSN
jgi:hypothetical protein